MVGSSHVADLSHAVIFDFKKAVDFFAKSRYQDDTQIAFAFQMARINFMGTDGIRGKISTEPGAGCLEEIVSNNTLVPEMIWLGSISESFVTNSMLPQTARTLIFCPG